MLEDQFIDCKNIYSLQDFRFKKRVAQEKRLSLQNDELFQLKEDKSSEQKNLTTKIENIKQSVQRINKLISELKQISDKPPK